MAATRGKAEMQNSQQISTLQKTCLVVFEFDQQYIFGERNLLSLCRARPVRAFIDPIVLSTVFVKSDLSDLTGTLFS